MAFRVSCPHLSRERVLATVCSVPCAAQVPVPFARPVCVTAGGRDPAAALQVSRCSLTGSARVPLLPPVVGRALATVCPAPCPAHAPPVQPVCVTAGVWALQRPWVMPWRGCAPPLRCSLGRFPRGPLRVVPLSASRWPLQRRPRGGGALVPLAPGAHCALWETRRPVRYCVVLRPPLVPSWRCLACARPLPLGCWVCRGRRVCACGRSLGCRGCQCVATGV